MVTSSNKKKILLLDGGMGHQLRAMGVPIQGEVGSLKRFLGVAVTNVEQPELVVSAHAAFLDAGADIITTNSYAVIPRVYDELARKDDDYDDDDDDHHRRDSIMSFKNMLVAACKAACAARNIQKSTNGNVLVAGSLPPLSESYRPDKVDTFENNLKDYRGICQIIAPYCDVILCETMSTADEAKAAATAAAATGKAVWVSWTLDETKPGTLRSGETLEDAVAALDPVKDAVAAYLVNCTSPESVSAAIPILSSLASTATAHRRGQEVRVGGYANGFITAASGQGEYRQDLSETEYYDKFVRQWIESGATIVGGCCGIFPHHIAYIRQQLDKTGNKD